MPSSDLTFVLAAIGAATGSISTITGVVTALRDRPRLSTDFGLTTRANGAPTIFIDVTNVGRRPTTVRQVGFYAKRVGFEVLRDDETEPWAHGEAEVSLGLGPVFLEAGKTERFEAVPDIEKFGIHADFPWRVYAVDITGRRLWGDAAPGIRMIFGDEPPFQPGDHSDFRALFEPARPNLRPSQVEPAWKLWKRQELRKPGAWRLNRKPRRHRGNVILR